MNFYPFHIGDYISHTSHLSDLEDLAYRRMMDLYYQTEEPFKDNLSVARKVKGSPDMVQTLLEEFFVQFDDGTWHNIRADKEIAKYQAKADSARNANRIKSEKISVLKSEPNHNVTKNQEPLTINHKPKITTPEGVSEFLFKDYLEVRKAKKAKWTETAYKGLQREAEKAKMSLSDVMQMCCERGWAGFKADWVKEEVAKQKQLPLVTNDQIEEAYRIECGKDPKLARFGSYYEMKDYVIKQRELRSRTQA
jgi:uncharacterized protein YdaU (DUF1376 family)